MGVVCLAVLLLAAGCIQVEQAIEIRPDGSGTLDLSYGMSRETVGQIEGAVREASGLEQEPDATPSSPMDFDEASIRESFKDFEPHGVTLASLETETRADWKFMRLKIAFRDLAGLTKTSFFSDRNVSLRRNAEGHYTFRLAAGANDAEASGPTADSPEMEQLAKEIMKGFRMAVSITAPGRVLATSGDRKDDHTVAWEFDLDKDPQAVSRAGSLDMWVTFDGEGLKIPEFQTSEERDR